MALVRGRRGRVRAGRGALVARLAAPTHVRLNIYDVTGRLVARLADRAFDPGDHTLEWDGAHATGGRAPAGIYFYELAAPGWRVARRLTLTR